MQAVLVQLLPVVHHLRGEVRYLLRELVQPDGRLRRVLHQRLGLAQRLDHADRVLHQRQQRGRPDDAVRPVKARPYQVLHERLAQRYLLRRRPPLQLPLLPLCVGPPDACILLRDLHVDPSVLDDREQVRCEPPVGEQVEEPFHIRQGAARSRRCGFEDIEVGFGD